MESKDGHIQVINSLRGLAALSVCLYHFICTTTDYITNELVLDFFHYGNKGVHVFFIISGIVIPLSMIKGNYSYNSFSKFILKRFVRIEPPYIGVVIIGIIYLYARNFVPSSTAIDLTPSFRDIVLHLGYLVPFVEDAKWINPVFWTLSIEFQYYLVLAITFPLVLSKNHFLRYVFYAIVLLSPLLLETTKDFYPFWSPYFSLGIFYILFKTQKIIVVEYVIVTLIASVLIVNNLSFLDLFIGLGTLAVIHLFASFKNKVGEFLGDISYSVYLLHSVIGSAFVNFMSHRFTESYQKAIVIILGVVLTMIVSFIYWKLIEKPSQKLAKKIKLKNIKSSKAVDQ